MAEHPWKDDGHHATYEGEVRGEKGTDGVWVLHHPESCLVERRSCPHREGAEKPDEHRGYRGLLIFADYEHTGEDCPDPISYFEPNCTLAFEEEGIGFGRESYLGDEAAINSIEQVHDANESVSNPVPIEYYHQSHHTYSSPAGPEEWWTEWGWRIKDNQGGSNDPVG